MAHNQEVWTQLFSAHKMEKGLQNTAQAIYSVIKSIVLHYSLVNPITYFPRSITGSKRIQPAAYLLCARLELVQKGTFARKLKVFDIVLSLKE